MLLQGEEQAANRRRLAELHAANGDVEAAIDAYRSALEADPGDLPSLRALLPLLEESERLREAVEVRRHLAELVSPEERIECLHALGVTLSDRLDDAESAIPVFAELAEIPGAPPDSGGAPREPPGADGPLRSTQRASRRATRELDSESPEARDLDLRRAEILQDRLGLPAQAAALLAKLYEREPECPEIRASLERSAPRVERSRGSL